jgi:hypothetical protein
LFAILVSVSISILGFKGITICCVVGVTVVVLTVFSSSNVTQSVIVKKVKIEIMSKSLSFSISIQQDNMFSVVMPAVTSNQIKLHSESLIVQFEWGITPFQIL